MSISGNNILAGASGNQGYEIDRSLRFNSGDSAHLTRTPSSASNSTTFTWSAWIKVDGSTGTQVLFSATSSGTLQYDFILTNNQLDVYGIESVFVWDKKLSRVFRDPSAWYHLVVAFDTTDSTAEDRIKIYVNGERETDFATNTNPSASRTTGFNKTVEHSIGGRTNYSTGQYFDGYQTEINFIDGSQLGPENFGETDPVTGAWIPKQYSGTYGTNGFYLNFSDNSGVTATTLGKDSSGNGNNWTPNNFSVTAGTGNDSLEDTPTNNWCTLNPLKKGTITVSEGSLKAVGGADYQAIHGTIGLPSSGKFYWEATVNSSSGAVTDQFVGVAGNDTALTGTSPYPQGDTPALYYVGTGTLTKNGTSSVQTGLGAFAADDVIGVAYDADGATVQFYKNGTAVGTAESLPSTTETLFPAYVATTNRFANFNWGQRSFDQTPPTGFKSLNTANLPVPTVKDGTEYFNTVLYTGTGSSNSITGVGFQPDWVWIKKRSASENHELQDAVRGATKRLASNSSAAESTVSGSISSFDSDGFTVVDAGTTNENTSTYVAWNWKANGSGSANTDGSISSTVSVNADAGFSIGTFSGTAAVGSIGHGLGIAPKWILMKNRGSSSSWAVYHDAVGANKQLLLNSSNASSNDTNGFPSAPTSTVINVGTGSAMDTNQSGSHVFYAFAEVKGYSKFGSYTGNGSDDGPFVYCGFKPSWVMAKVVSGTTGSWNLFDAARDPFNEVNISLLPNSGNADDTITTQNDLDFCSNGFKIRENNNNFNKSGSTFIFMAFAEAPFKYANAR